MKMPRRSRSMPSLWASCQNSAPRQRIPRRIAGHRQVDATSQRTPAVRCDQALDHSRRQPETKDLLATQYARLRLREPAKRGRNLLTWLHGPDNADPVADRSARGEICGRPDGPFRACGEIVVNP